MGKDEAKIRGWLLKHQRYLASFDLNKDKKLQPDEISWAVKVLEQWSEKRRNDATRWRMATGDRQVVGLTFAQLGRRCATAPMTFVGVEADDKWLPFAALLRHEDPALPELFEEDIDIPLLTVPTPPQGSPQTLGSAHVDRLCGAPAIGEVVGAYSTPKDTTQDLYLMELAIAQRLLEQEMRQLCRDRGGSAVVNVTRGLQPVGRLLHMSLSGTLCGARTP